MATRGDKRHRITLSNPTRVTDGEGYTETPVVFATPYAEIKPATARDLERTVANAVQSSASHLVTIDYIAGVTSQTIITFGTRTFKVTGIQNPEERNIELVIAATEVVA